MHAGRGAVKLDDAGEGRGPRHRRQRRAGGGEAALDQLRHAVADHGRDGVEREPPPPRLDEQAIERRGDVRSAVDQRAVEVEEQRRAGLERGAQTALRLRTTGVVHNSWPFSSIA